MGVLLTVFVLALPKGLLPLVSAAYDRVHAFVVSRRLQVPLGEPASESGVRP
jgi:hypothetical protein